MSDKSEFFGFGITVESMYWINGEQDDPEDLCLHGRVSVRIGEERFDAEATLSAAALYLLRSLELDHVSGEDEKMLPCCGNTFLLKEDGSGDVEILGCPFGVDWSVFHRDGMVRLVTDEGLSADVSLEDYRDVVFAFADQVVAFYRQSCAKVLPEDEAERNGYLAFWAEFERRRFRFGD